MSDPSPYVLSCDGCGTTVPYVPGTSPGSQVACPPDSGCCQEDHDHDEAAAACAADHSAHPCPTAELPGACPVTSDEACQGGHCGPGVQDCAVCRPITITAVAGAAHFGGEAS